MARKTLRAVQEQIENKFLDIEVPELDWVKVNLIETKTTWIDNKTEAVEKVENNFNVTIYVGERLNSEDKELSKKVQEICHLNFPPYYWKEKAYRFYTTERTGNEELKKEILTNLLTNFKEYEKDKKNQFEESNKVFEEDAKNKIKLDSVDLLMKFHEETNRFVVLAKDFIGPEKYALLRRASEYSGNLVHPDFIGPENINKYALTTEFFKEDMPNKKLEKKTYFFINPSMYENVKLHFGLEKKAAAEFLESQKKISQQHDLSQYDLEVDNVFDLKIKFVPENQCFEFYGKGYFDSVGFNGMRSQRGLLAMWALNFIYSEDKLDVNTYAADDIIVDGKDKIHLETVKGGSKKEKNVRIPASEWQKVAKIKENFEEVNKFWSRPEKSIKITHCDFSSLNLLDRFPAVFFDKKGESYLAFSSRRMGVFKALGQNSINQNDFMDDVEMIHINEDGTEKKKRDVKFSQTLKTIPISFKEATYFMEEHPFSDFIKRGTVELNTKVWGPENQFGLSKEEKDQVFNTILLHAEIYDQTKGTDKPKAKKFKL